MTALQKSGDEQRKISKATSSCMQFPSIRMYGDKTELVLKFVYFIFPILHLVSTISLSLCIGNMETKSTPETCCCVP